MPARVNILAANFGRSPRDFAQGDFNYDGTVNLQDFNILASRFGTVVASTAPARAPAFGDRTLPKDADTDDDVVDEALA
jgi:hypothetical protein